MNNVSPEDSPIKPHYPAEWSTWTRRLAVVILLLGGLLLVYLLGPVLQIMVLALLLAFALFYPVRALARRFHLSYELSVGITFIVYLTIVIALLINLTASVRNFITSISDDLQESVDRVLDQVINYTPGSVYLENPLNGERLIDLDFIFEPLNRIASGENMEEIAGNVAGVFPNIRGTATSTVGVISGFIGTFFLANFLALLFLLEFPHAFAWGINATAPTYRREVGILVHRISRVWTSFFRGQLIISAAIGVLTWLQLLVMGINGAVVVGLFTGVVSLIPMLGGIISLVPIGLAPLLQGSSVFPDLSPLVLTLLVLVPNFIVQQIISNVVSPKITGDAVNLPVPVIILGLVIGNAFAGIMGALLAAPMMGTIKIIVEYVLKKIRGGDPFPDESEPEFMTTRVFSEAMIAAQEDEAQPTPTTPPV
jgi:predicted PurR-regulated permease PerM